MPSPISRHALVRVPVSKKAKIDISDTELQSHSEHRHPCSDSGSSGHSKVTPNFAGKMLFGFIHSRFSDRSYHEKMRQPPVTKRAAFLTMPEAESREGDGGAKAPPTTLRPPLSSPPDPRWPTLPSLASSAIDNVAFNSLEEENLDEPPCTLLPSDILRTMETSPMLPCLVKERVVGIWTFKQVRKSLHALSAIVRRWGSLQPTT